MLNTWGGIISRMPTWMRVLLDESIYPYKELVYLHIFSLFHSIILLLLWCDYGQSYGFVCIYLEGTNSWACAPFVNNIYAMYIILCESLISMLLLFKSTYKKGLKSPRTRKFSGRGDVMLVSSLKSKGILVQVNDEVKTLVSMDKTTLKDVQPRPAHGRGNA